MDFHRLCASWATPSRFVSCVAGLDSDHPDSVRVAPHVATVDEPDLFSFFLFFFPVPL